MQSQKVGLLRSGSTAEQFTEENRAANTDAHSSLQQENDLLRRMNSTLQKKADKLRQTVSDLQEKNKTAAEVHSPADQQTFAVRPSNSNYGEMFLLAPVPYVRLNDDRQIKQINLAGTSLLKRGSKALVGSCLSSLLQQEDKDTFFEYLDQVEKSALSESTTVRLVLSRNVVKTIQLVTTAVRVKRSAKYNYQMMLIDITEQIETEERLRKARDFLAGLAHHDTLTALPNRLLFSDALTNALAQARNNNRSVGLLYFDLDGFKSINDKYGHHVGDHVLTSIAERLRSYISPDMTVSRIGGDEFTLLIPDTDGQSQVQATAADILKLISQPIAYNNELLKLTSSIGVSVFPESADSSDQLMKIADAAMYRSKRNGKNQVSLGDADDLTSMVGSLDLTVS